MTTHSMYLLPLEGRLYNIFSGFATLAENDAEYKLHSCRVLYLLHLVSSTSLGKECLENIYLEYSHAYDGQTLKDGVPE